MENSSDGFDADGSEVYFSGARLIGNDFSPEELEKWFEDERDGFADLGNSERQAYQYEHHALNRLHGYSQLKLVDPVRALGFGAAYGDELVPIASALAETVVLDPSDHFAIDDSPLGSVRWQRPQVSGVIDCPDDSFELATSLGALHHVANVEFVLSELFRVLAPGGFLLLREPIISMGDWRSPRSGLTKRERGIPQKLLFEMCRGVGFQVQSTRYCVFGPLQKLAQVTGKSNTIYNSELMARLDAVLSFAFRFNAGNYRREKLWQKFAPVSVYLVLRKP